MKLNRFGVDGGSGCFLNLIRVKMWRVWNGKAPMVPKRDDDDDSSDAAIW